MAFWSTISTTTRKKSYRWLFLALTLAFGILMSVPYSIPHAGWVALFGFIPLLVMDMAADRMDVKKFFLWYYAAFVLWNAISTLWVCKATIGGGIFAVLANALLMSVVFAVYRLGKRKFKGVIPYVFLAAAWVAWERLFFSTQISWPWLTLGNALARTVRLAQWYEYTGTLGGSLWILSVNIWLFLALCRNGRKRLASLCGCAVLVLGPVTLSLSIYHNYPEDAGEGMDVYICQPNFDPYEKKTGIDKTTQASIYMSLVDETMESYRQNGNEPSLLLAPETFTNDVILNNLSESTTLMRFHQMLRKYPGLNFLFGASTREYIRSAVQPSLTVRHIRDDFWVQGRNSAMMMDATGRTEIYHKSKLVVGTELTPYPRIFNKVDDLLGGVMGRCAGQDHISLLNAAAYDSTGKVSASVPVGCAVCYESVYGEYCTGYVKAGAKALAIITNDAWWGKTQGYLQHLSYASLRAIELRRDVARCANTGISAIIDQRGEVLLSSEWAKREAIQGRINLSSRRTAFVRYGDITGRLCTLVFLCMAAVLAALFVSTKKK